MPHLIRMGVCPHHGRVIAFAITDTQNPTISTGEICQICYVEWVKENVPKLADVQLVQVG